MNQKRKTIQEISDLMSAGWTINWTGRVTRYWLSKRGEQSEHLIAPKRLRELLDKGIIDKNYYLIR